MSPPQTVLLLESQRSSRSNSYKMLVPKKRDEVACLPIERHFIINTNIKNNSMKPSKKTLSIARLLHIYVSMALFTLLLFFSVTGITLNHPQWFSTQHAQVLTQEKTIASIKDLAIAKSIISKKQLDFINTEIELAFSISLLNTSPELMSGELFYSMKQPGISTSISLVIETGEAFYERTHYGWWAVFNDLHKGRNTSDFWRWIIDLSSMLFIIFAITGFMLAMPQKRFRQTLLVSISTTTFAIFTMIYFA
ncbi:PepSY-associated TM helix domain-containing protein [Colwelliaceae bacterium 6441]